MPRKKAVKYRDALTGEYISEEEALERDPATWVAESATPRKRSPKKKPTKGVSIELPCPVVYKGKIYTDTVQVPQEELEEMKEKLAYIAERKCKKWL